MKDLSEWMKRRMQQQIEAREVWFAWVRYEESPMQGKNRPVLVMDVEGNEALVLAVPFTSVHPRDEYDIEVFDWSDIPLDHLSTARVSKVLRIPVSDFVRKLGRISDDDWDNITNLLMDYLMYHDVE